MHENSVYLADLTDNAPKGRNDKNGGHSYEVAGFLNFGGANNPRGVRKTQKSVASYTYHSTQPSYTQLSAKNQRASVANIWVIYDADDQDATDPTRRNEDFPDPGDNHGTLGGNIVFAEGHAEWVPHRRYLQSFILGTDEDHSPVVGQNPFADF